MSETEIIRALERETGKSLPTIKIDDIMGESNGYSVSENGKFVIGLNLNFLKITDSSFLYKLKNLTHFSLKEAEISDTSFLKVLTNLTHLILKFQGISDYSVLRNLKKLEHLSLKFEQVSDLHFLRVLKKLKYLHLYSDNENITELNLCQLKIEEISLNGKLKNLTHLELYGNLISNLLFIEELKELSHLNLKNNRISNISSLKGLKKLTRLDLSENQISNTPIFQEMKNLTHLHLNTTHITDFSFLKEIENLSTLTLKSNKIRDIAFINPLQRLKILRHIDLMDNEIEKLPESIMDFEIEICHDKNFQPEKEGINFYGNPLKEPPVEIVKKGKESIDFFIKNKPQSIEDTFTGKKALSVLKQKVQKGDLIDFLLKDSNFSGSIDDKKELLVGCIDRLYSKIKYDSGKREVQACLELLRKEKQEKKSSHNNKFEIFLKLINNENFECLYKNWSKEQQRFFDDAFKVILYWKDFFLSYTTRNVWETNNDFKEIISCVFSTSYIKQEKGNKNFLAELIVKYLTHENLSGFFDKKDMTPGDEFKKKMIEECKNCFVFVQLIEDIVFSKTVNDETNWCHFEFENFYKGENSLPDCKRYFFMVTDREIIPKKNAVLKEHEHWVKTIRDTDFIDIPVKFKNVLRRKISKLSEEIRETKRKILKFYLEDFYEIE